MNYKAILFFLGIYSLLVSLFCVLNIFYSIYFDFAIGINSYLATFLISLILGLLFHFVGRNYKKDINLTDQIIFILLSFIFIPCLIAIPYYLSIYNIGLLNSYFESISGFTTTGFSIIDSIENIDEPNTPIFNQFTRGDSGLKRITLTSPNFNPFVFGDGFTKV